MIQNEYLARAKVRNRDTIHGTTSKLEQNCHPRGNNREGLRWHGIIGNFTRKFCSIQFIKYNQQHVTLVNNGSE
jgi:hypothetical protein